MYNRYTRKAWRSIQKEMPFHIRINCASQDAPPGFVRVSFATDEAQEWVEQRLGKSEEPNFQIDLKRARKQRHWVAVEDVETEDDAHKDDSAATANH